VTRTEIVDNVRLSLRGLAAIRSEYAPALFEARFGLEGEPPLIVADGEDRFALRGLIDRIDRTKDGRLRIIDYKTGGPSGYSNTDIARGKKLQLPLYALAAQDALHLGEVADGFYWHVLRSEASSFSVARFPGGPRNVLDTAVAHAWSAIRGARAGHFEPEIPAGGCPGWCPAISFCWRARLGYRG
jgi:RecB family exonuclease